MKTAFIFFLYLFLFINITSAQDSKIKFGKISPQDLSMKIYAPDTEAIAVILSKIGRVEFDVMLDKYPLTEERHIVIKLLKGAGIDDYGNAEIKYYSHRDYSRVTNIKAIVHLPDGTDVKVDNSQIFDERTNDYWSSKKIAFPGLVPGAIIEYQYLVQTDGMFRPIDWFFQDQIPIRYAELTSKIPDWYEYIVLTQGVPLDMKDSEISNEQLNLSSINRGSYSVSASEQTSISHSTVDVRYNKNTYINKDVPALKEECCITTMEDYYSRVRYQLQAVQFPNQAREPILNTWIKLAEELYAYQEWGSQFRNKNPGELVIEAAGINASDTNQMAIAQKLYAYINHTIEWNEIYGIGLSYDINAILKSKSGYSGDLNKLMCAALIQSGIEAKPVLVSTRDHGKPLEYYPFVDQFNHMVVLAKIDNKDTWIDLGDRFLPLGWLRTDALNSMAWVVDATEPYWVDLKPLDSKTVYLIKGSIDKDGNLNGDLESRYTGYHAVHHRTLSADEKEKYGESLITSGINHLPVSNTELINANETSKPFQVKAKIVNYSLATVTPDKIYINPVYPEGLDEIPFKLVERTYPIEMNYPEEISMIFNLAIPEGYIVESVPEPIRFTTENGGIQVIYEATQNPGKLNVTMKYILKQLLFDPLDYSTLKNIFNQRQQKFNEQIVLSKT